MELDIDVSGGDLLNKDYVICIANKEGIIKGFKFSNDLVNVLSSRFGQEFYKYKKSKKDKSTFKVRLYCIVIYYLFKSLRLSEEVSLNLCRDFEGREDDIKKSLRFFLEEQLGLKLEGRINFVRLDKDSNAHRYAFLMRHDNKNQMKTYVKLSLKEIEEWLKK